MLDPTVPLSAWQIGGILVAFALAWALGVLAFAVTVEYIADVLNGRR